MKIKPHLILITLLFLCLAATGPKTHAVVPAPDGCYPGFTTAEGCKALNFLSTGAGNTGIGWYSLYVDTTGSYNTGVGAGALALNNADSNTAVGAAALLLNTTGTENTAVGTDALVVNDAAEHNTATGAFALFSHVSGNGNTAVGADALFSDTSGQANTAIGAGALFSNVGGPFPGSFNTAVGYNTLFANTGGDNIAVGAQALQSNVEGNDNISVGVSALGANTSGNRNIALGTFAGLQQTTGSDNIYIGFQMEGTAGESNSCYIKSIFGQMSVTGLPVLINSNNKLGTIISSKRFKEDIKPMDEASNALFALKPVSFRYKKEIDPSGTSQLGLVAEDVQKVNPDLVVCDKEGKVYSVRYDQVNAMLLNEFLKAHSKIEQQEATIAELKSTLAQQQKSFQSELAEQEKRIQAVALDLQRVTMEMQTKNSAEQVIASTR
jgi:Chaperone of endosialidase